MEGTVLRVRTHGDWARLEGDVKTCGVTFYFDVFAKGVTREAAAARIEKRRARRKKKGLP